VTLCDQEGLQALLSHRYRAEVHGDVPLPRVDVRRPWRSGPASVAGGSSGGHGGVARVTTTVATTVALLAAVATAIAAVVVAVGWSGQCRMLRLRSRRRSAGIERRRSSRRPSSVQVDLLQKEVITNFKKVWQW
jgi:hypothetical protein